MHDSNKESTRETPKQGGVTLVTGPARAGKTQWLITQYREALAESAFSKTLWIAPNQRIALAVREQLLSQNLRACFEPGITTFDRFAEQIIASSGATSQSDESSENLVQMISSSQQRLLLQSLIHQLKQNGQLPYYREIAETEGFLDLLTEVIREFKRLEIWPEELETASQRQGQNPKDRELIALYQAYQEILNEHHLYDPQGRFWSARSRLKKTEIQSVAEINLLVVDGFTDFTRPQHDILTSLAARSQKVLLSLPQESESGREDLFSKTTKTRQELQKRFPTITQHVFPRQRSHWPALDHLESELFKSPRDIRPFKAPLSDKIIREKPTSRFHDTDSQGAVPTDPVSTDTVPTDTVLLDPVLLNTVPSGTVPPNTVPPNTVPPNTVSTDPVSQDSVSQDSVSQDSVPQDLVRQDQAMTRQARVTAPQDQSTRGTTANSLQIEILATSGKLGEIESLARKIKQLLGCQKVSPSQIGVVFRSPGESASLVREIFLRYGIPFALESQQNLEAAPMLRALTALLRLDLEDWPFRPLLQILGNNYLRPAFLDSNPRALDDPNSQKRASQAALRFVRQLQIPKGRKSLLRELDYWTQQAESLSTNAPKDSARGSGIETAHTTPGPPPPKESSSELSSELSGAPPSLSLRGQLALTAAPLFQILNRSLEALPKKATLAEWSDALRILADQLGFLTTATGSSRIADSLGVTPTEPSQQEALDQIDRLGWQRLHTLFETANRVSAWGGGSQQRSASSSPPTKKNVGAKKNADTKNSLWTRQEIVSLLSDWLRTEPLGETHDETGSVRVLSAQSARNLQFDYLFLAGLTEKSFPAADREDRLISESDIQRLSEGGLPLVDRRTRMRDEMLLFYEVVTRPNKQLTLSYPALDEKAQPLLPSPYLQEIEKLFPYEGLERTNETDLNPVPRNSLSFSPREVRIAAVAKALEGNAQGLAALVAPYPAPGAKEKKSAALALLQGLSLVADRRKGDRFGPYEGILLGEKAQQVLAKRFGPEHLWSPSRLEQFALCPYQFFLQRVLKIEPLEDLTLETDYLRRGRMLHETLASVHEKLNQSAQEPAAIGPLGAEFFTQEFQAAIQDLIDAEKNFGEVTEALIELDRREVLRWGERYFQQHVKYEAAWNDLDEPLRPAHFEVRFGPAQRESEEVEDSLSTDEPFALDLDGEKLLLTGRIDRLDLGVLGERPVFNVIDYKSSKRTQLNIEAIQDGLALQLPLYSMAVEELLLADQNAAPWQAGYWTLQGSGFSLKQSLKMASIEDAQAEPTSEWLDLRETVKQRIKTLVHEMRRGEFPVFSRDENCTGSCVYKTVCRVNHIRSLGKSWPPEKLPDESREECKETNPKSSLEKKSNRNES